MTKSKLLHNIPKKEKEAELRKAGWEKIRKDFWVDPVTDIEYLVGLAFCVLKQTGHRRKKKKR